MSARNRSNSILPDPDIDLLRSSAAESGFRNVYRCTSARDDRWCAKIKYGSRLRRIPGSAGPLAHQAALHVLHWYRERYGARWAEAVRRRKARLKPYDLRHTARGWAVDVWEFGRPVPLCGRRKPGRTGQKHDSLTNCDLQGPRWAEPGRPLAFATRERAAAAVAVWAQLWWGDHARLALWRY